MKKFLVITQIIYALSFLAWIFIWLMSFMVFDQGIALWNSLFFLVITIYPIVVVVCSALGWFQRNRRRKLAAVLNLVPMLWIIPFVVFLLTSW
ncbi:hypothetical protein A8990_11219 [Paenibacillus taihuensis]|uniref:Uncharacterized protein n=1 Tax=Paenibacillus taihuensis TaxID=1156355 RepID=A0A3D9S8P8_9BACL|nr:hypothetical protein [Paenibacillus taihuensis]REE85290.1 hypothetical protein A8990_11219 [Paenibacillus taihuensis]